ncbi:MAG: serine/threonine protein kinase [Bradymonadia bacterium]|jgi:serine/threonine protein kinase
MTTDANMDGASATSGASLIGRSLDQGRYTVLKLIGEGGMGVVYQALQMSMDRMVAMKILRAQLATDEKLLARFKQEALSVSRLRHPNTITVYDYGRTKDGLLFIAMELLGGQSLFDLLTRRQHLSLNRTLHIMTQICGAVAEAHQLGVVHRDLKPENIQIDSVGGDDYFAKVLDFGIAKIVHGDGEQPEGKTLTMAGAIFGTPAYMSPEQVHGEKVDHRTDVYAMGIILFELLAGRQPFIGATPMAIMMAQASKPVPVLKDVCPDADVVPEVLAVIDRCLQKDREDRYATADDLLRALQQIQVQLGDISRSRMQVQDSQWGAGQSKTADRAKVASAPPLPPVEDPTPAAGHIATIPPLGVGDDELYAANASRRGVWWAIIVTVLVGGVFAYAGLRTDEVEPDPVLAASSQSVAALSTPAKITYYFVSNPTGATVFDGDLKVGVTPTLHAWQHGVRKTFRLELNGHEPQTIQAAGVGGPVEERLVHLTPRTTKLAPMEIGSTPEGATVTADGVEIGQTGRDPLIWTPPPGTGPVSLSFTLDGHTPRIRSMDRQLIGHGSVAVTVKLTATATAPKSTEPARPKRPKVVKARSRPKTRKRPKVVSQPKVVAPPTSAPASVESKRPTPIYKKL